MKKKWQIAVGVLALLVCTAAGLALVGGKPAQPWVAALAGSAGAAKPGMAMGKDGKPDIPLEFAAREVVRPTLARMPSLIEFSGPLVAPQTAIVRVRAGGTLVALTVAEGSRVQAGQAVGRIEQADLASRLAERKANLDSMRAALVQAERTHASNERLAQQNFISPIALENSRAALDTARAQLEQAQASLGTTQALASDTRIVAPIAGIVAKRHVLPGEKVSVEQQVLTIVDLARLELAGTVGTHEVSRLAPGMAVQVLVEGLAQPAAGRIARIAPAAEPGTRSIGVTVGLDNPKEALRAGQYAMARVTLADDTERLTLPVAAIGSSSGQDLVWVIDGGVLARRAVTLGRRDERAARVELLAGVTPATQVLAARFDNLREGARAIVVGSRAVPPTPAAASMPAAR